MHVTQRLHPITRPQHLDTMGLLTNPLHTTHSRERCIFCMKVIDSARPDTCLEISSILSAIRTTDKSPNSHLHSLTGGSSMSESSELSSYVRSMLALSMFVFWPVTFRYSCLFAARIFLINNLLKIHLFRTLP